MDERTKIKPSKKLREFCKDRFGYTGRKFFVEYCDTLMFHTVAWCGGSKNDYTFLAVDGYAENLPFGMTNPFSQACVEGKTIDMVPECAVIEHSEFCGHKMGITVFLFKSHKLAENVTAFKLLAA